MALNKEVKETIVKNFGRSAMDTGSMDVQVALLTQNIEQISEHLKINPKDSSAKRGLLKLIARRRTFLRYIEQKDETRYKDIIKRLTLRK